MTQSRISSRVRSRTLAVTLTLGLALLATAKADGQYWNTYYGGLYPGYAGIYPAYTGITPAYTGITPAYTGITPAYTGLPGFGTYGFYDPYAWYEDAAYNDSLALASYGMAGARFDLANASAASNSTAYAMIKQAAQAEASWQRSLSGNATSSPRYSVRAGRNSSMREHSPQTLITSTSRDGDVLWPVTSPNAGDLFEKRQEASRAIKAVVRDYRSRGIAPVDEVVSALRALHGYVDPAVATLRKERPGDVNAFIDFAEGLDSGLRSLTPEAQPGSAEAPKGEASKPEAPKR